MTDIDKRYAELGGADGLLGRAMTGEVIAHDGIGRFAHYEHGSIFWTAATGAHEVLGAIRARWAELRWERSLLGYPNAAPHNNGTDIIASFQHGSIEMTLVNRHVRTTKRPTPQAPNYIIPITA